MIRIGQPSAPNFAGNALAVMAERDRRDQQGFTNRLAVQDRQDQRDQFSQQMDFRQQQFAADQDYRQQTLGLDRERLAMAREAGRMAVAQEAAQMNAAQLQAEAERAQRLGMAIRQAEEAGDTQAIVNLLRAEEPEIADQLTPETLPIVLESLRGGLDFFEGYQAAGPQTPEVPAAFRALELRAQAAGLEPGTAAHADFMARGGKIQTVTEIQNTPDGSFTYRQGDIAQSDAPKRFGVKSPESMVMSIDGILEDPALPYATGMAAPLGNIPGTGMRRVQARMDQLDGQAFLQAFESLQGGGQITDFEGQKATQAIARLDKYQSHEDYVAALQELRDLLVLGSSRPRGFAERRRNELMAPEVGVVEDGYRFIGGDPADPNSWEPE